MLTVFQMHLEAIYRTGAPDIRNFLIDRQALVSLLGQEPRAADEWVLVRESDDGLDLAVYIADQHLHRLEDTTSPRDAVSRSFRAFCAAVEGISHFLTLVERARRDEPISLLELETQAEVDKFVCASLHFPERRDEWLARLFRDCTLHSGMTPLERERYLEAGRLARAYCTHLNRLPHVGALLAQLRIFWRDSGARRMDAMRRLAA